MPRPRPSSTLLKLASNLPQGLTLTTPLAPRSATLTSTPATQPALLGYHKHPKKSTMFSGDVNLASFDMTELQPSTSQPHNVGVFNHRDSDDIPTKLTAEVKSIPWTMFLTLEEGRRGWYRPRLLAPVAYGGFSDIWLCDARLSTTIQVVAAKKLRASPVFESPDGGKAFHKLAKYLMKELNVWMALQHLNIAPLLGYTFTPEMCLISPWFANGNLANFLKAKPSANRTNLTRGIAEGLAYLHCRTPAVVHGDIKPDNVLIDESGIPVLIDFGLSNIVESDPELASHSCTSLRGVGNDRWIAPELLLQDGVSRSCSTDVYSFGCLTFFTFTGDHPFKELPERRLAVARCLEKAQPISPGHTYPVLAAEFGIMKILSACWMEEPLERPTMLSITQQQPLSQHQPSQKLLRTDPAKHDPIPLVGANGRVFHERSQSWSAGGDVLSNLGAGRAGEGTDNEWDGLRELTPTVTVWAQQQQHQQPGVDGNTWVWRDQQPEVYGEQLIRPATAPPSTKTNLLSSGGLWGNDFHVQSNFIESGNNLFSGAADDGFVNLGNETLDFARQFEWTAGRHILLIPDVGRGEEETRMRVVDGMAEDLGLGSSQSANSRAGSLLDEGGREPSGFDKQATPKTSHQQKRQQQRQQQRRQQRQETIRQPQHKLQREQQQVRGPGLPPLVTSSFQKDLQDLPSRLIFNHARSRSDTIALTNATTTKIPQHFGSGDGLGIDLFSFFGNRDGDSSEKSALDEDEVSANHRHSGQWRTPPPIARTMVANPDPLEPFF